MNKLAKLKYLSNNFEIIEDGDYVICAISGKKIPLENLNYWNVEEQEAYFSYVEASKKKDGMPTEENVAAHFLLIIPLFPTPDIIILPFFRFNIVLTI